MNNWHNEDPQAAREAATYASPVPSREFILQTLSAQKKLLGRADLEQIFNLTDEEQIEALRRRLRAMERDGQLLFTRGKTYAIVDKLPLIKGIVSAKRDGIGYVLPQKGGDDLFLNTKQMSLVFDGDEVLVQATPKKSGKCKFEANIVEVIKRAHPYIIGSCEIIDGIGVVTPQSSKISQQILLEPQQDLANLNGKIIKVEITKWPTKRLQAIGVVSEVLGDFLDNGLEITIALQNNGIPYLWSDEVQNEAAKIGKKISKKDKSKRLDLTHLPFVTIDGADAKDFDDAVFCEANNDIWQLYVAIADVAHYVKPNSALDLEAAKRGNSVYFPSLVVPMLPEELSNDLCSLKPNVERLALVCIMQISKSGELLKFEFAPSVIKSHARLTYGQAADFLQNNNAADLGANAAQISPSLCELYKLYQALLISRRERGALDFTTRESVIKLDANGKIAAIHPVIRNDAHRLIEECMLLANVAAAKLMLDAEIPALYRIHEPPHIDKVTGLKEFLAPLGLSLIKSGKHKEPTPQDYQDLIVRTKGRHDAGIIQVMLLRSLSQAVYSTEAKPHFGLNFAAYTHFTSPIRRYPDLLIHRAIYASLKSTKSAKTRLYSYDLKQLNAFASHCSQTERRADETTREVIKWLKCEYMQQHLGASFDGIISSVTSFGIFVELSDILIEGLVHISALPSDYYEFDSARQCLIGEFSGRKFKLGEKVKIQVARVNLNERKIDFILAKSANLNKCVKKHQISGNVLFYKDFFIFSQK